MTVSNTTRKVSYVGDGVTTSFSFPYKIFDSSELKVYQYTTDDGLDVDNDILTITTNYTVTINTTSEGGSVAIVSTAPASTETLLIVRDVAETQGTDFPTEDNFPETSVENSLDKLTMQNIEQAEDIARAVKLNVSSTTTDIEIEELVANKILLVNSDATKITNSTSSFTDIQDDLATVAGISANVTTVAGISGNVTTVAGISGNVTTVAGISADVTTVAGIAADISSVAQALDFTWLNYDGTQDAAWTDFLTAASNITGTVQCCAVSSDIAVVVYAETSAAVWKAVAIKKDGTVGTPVTIITPASITTGHYKADVCKDGGTDNKFCVAVDGGSNTVYFNGGTVNTTTLDITAGTQDTISTIGATLRSVALCPVTTDKVFLTYFNDNASGGVVGHNLAATGATYAASSAGTLSSTTDFSDNSLVAIGLSSSVAVVVIQDNNGSPYELNFISVDVSGAAPSVVEVQATTVLTGVVNNQNDTYVHGWKADTQLVTATALSSSATQYGLVSHMASIKSSDNSIGTSRAANIIPGYNGSDTAGRHRLAATADGKWIVHFTTYETGSGSENTYMISIMRGSPALFPVAGANKVVLPADGAILGDISYADVCFFEDDNYFLIVGKGQTATLLGGIIGYNGA